MGRKRSIPRNWETNNDTEEQINDIQHNVAVYARKWIYSRNPLTEKQLRIVKEAKKEF